MGHDGRGGFWKAPRATISGAPWWDMLSPQEHPGQCFGELLGDGRGRAEVSRGEKAGNLWEGRDSTH